MWQSNKERLRREQVRLETERANEAARSILPRSAALAHGLEGEAAGRAASLLAARAILGDITTDELLDAADWIDSGARYDEDDEDQPVFDESRDYFTRMNRQLETYSRGYRLQPHIDRINAPEKTGKSPADAGLDRWVTSTPHSAPLVPRVGEETERVTTTPLIPVTEAEIEGWNEDDEDLGEINRARWGTTEENRD